MGGGSSLRTMILVQNGLRSDMMTRHGIREALASVLIQTIATVFSLVMDLIFSQPCGVNPRLLSFACHFHYRNLPTFKVSSYR